MKRTIVQTICDHAEHGTADIEAHTYRVGLDDVVAEIDLCTEHARVLDVLRPLVHESDRVISGSPARFACEADGCEHRFTTGARRNDHYRAEHPQLAPEGTPLASARAPRGRSRKSAPERAGAPAPALDGRQDPLDESAPIEITTRTRTRAKRATPA